jgi:hypothetical protein
MERQMIERLAMDAALGELNEDASALLDAYLAEHPDAREWAKQMTSLCERTQAVICEKTQQKEVSARACRRVRIHWATPARWAAVVVISLTIGASVDRWLKPHPIPSSPTVAVETTRSGGPRSWQEVLSDSSGGFWQAKAAAMWQSKPQRTTHSQPSLWETFRQLQKERSHE